MNDNIEPTIKDSQDKKKKRNLTLPHGTEEKSSHKPMTIILDTLVDNSTTSTNNVC